MEKPEYKIAVTGLNATDSPGSGLAVIKALKEATSFDVRIIGLSYESMEPAIYIPGLIDKTYQIPFPSVGQEHVLDRLKYIKSVEGIDFLFPNFDAEILNFIKLKKRLSEDLNIKMVLPTEEQFEARHKARLFDYGEKHDILVPRARMVFNLAELEAATTEYGYPLVVKGKYYDAGIANNLDQAIRHFNRINAEWGVPVLVQEFINGSELNVCGIADGKGNLLGAVPMRKLLITDKGKAWSGVTIDDTEMLNITKKFAKSTNWLGAFELEFMKTDDGSYYLLEINPRFPAWCYLAVGAGQNQIESLVNLAMGSAVKPFESFEVGKMFIRYSNDLIVDIKEFEKISIKGEF